MFFYDPTIILIIPVLILAFYAQSKVKGNFNKYKKLPCSINMTGEQLARNLLERNGVRDVDVKPVKGVLSDHYHPTKKEVRLSEEIYYGKSVSAISIAAHEVGHALQHANGYYPLQLRANILPVANIGSTMAFPMFIIGFLFRTPFLMDIGIILFAAALVFHVVTLPVEFNASKRAIKQLSDGFVIYPEEMKGAKVVLNAAALTYIASTLMALVQLIRLIVLRGSRN